MYLAVSLLRFMARVNARIPVMIIVPRINMMWFIVRFGRSFEMATAAPVLVRPML